MALNCCAECGRPIGQAGPAWDRWRHVPDEDELLDARGHDGETLLRRRFVCSAVTPAEWTTNVPRERAGYCYSPRRHQLYAGTCATDWALVADRVAVSA